MKLTTKLIKQLIKEELQKIQEEVFRFGEPAKEEKIIGVVSKIHRLEKDLSAIKDYIQRFESLPYDEQSQETGQKAEKYKKMLAAKEASIAQKKEELESLGTSYDVEMKKYLQELRKKR